MNEALKSGDGRLHGAWSHLTIDALIETAARARPQRRSFCDAPDISEWSDLRRKTTSLGEIGQLVTRFALQMTTLGLRKGDRVIVAMPNCVDGVIAQLGLVTAGYVPCPISVVAPAGEIRQAAEAISARAIVTVNRYADFRPSEAARIAASAYYGIRFICAFGPGAPDGVIDMDGWPDSELSRDPLPMNESHAPALITFDWCGEAVSPHMRTHAQLISDALALSAISGLTSRGSIIATFAPVSAAGFASTIAAPLISGTMVQLHGPFDADVLKAQIAEAPESIVVMPASVEDAVRRAIWPAVGDTIVVTRDLSSARTRGAPGRVTELVSLGEAALWPLLRDNTRMRPRLPRFFAHPVGTALPRTAPLFEIALSGRGRLALSGFGVAFPLSEGKPHAQALETRWLVHGDGPEHYTVVPDEADRQDEAAQFSVAAA